MAQALKKSTKPHGGNGGNNGNNNGGEWW